MTDSESRSEQSSDGADDAVQAAHVGALLCATRMRLGGDLQEIAKILRIRYGYLVAIEDGRYEDLPGAAYSVGFVRAYADYLGLDGDEVVRRLRDESSGTAKTARYEFPAPSGESGLPNAGLLAIAIGLGMVVYGVWYTTTTADRDAVDLIQEVPSRLAVLLDEDATGQQPAMASVSESAGAIAPVGVVTETDRMADDAVTDAQLESTAVEIAEAMVSGPSIGDVSDDVEGTDSSPSLSAPAAVSELRSFETTTDVAEVAEAEADSQTVMQEIAQAQAVNETTETQSQDTEVLDELASGVDEPELVIQTAGASDEAAPVNQPETQSPAVETTEPDTPEAQTAAADSEETVRSQSDREQIALAAPATENESAPAEVQQTSSGADRDQRERTEESTPMSEVSAVTEEADASGQDVAVAVAEQNVDNTIELRAKSDSWIQVRDGDDLLLTRLLRQGEVYTVPDRRGLTLMTGNAGGLEVFVDGELMPPLGDVGVVRRGVPLNADRLRTGVEPG